MAQPLTLQEIQARPEYLRLPAQRKVFMVEYLQNGCRVLPAVLRAYPATAKPKTAAVMGYEILGQRDVKACVDLFFGRDKEMQMQDLKQEVLESVLGLIKRSTRRGKPTPELVETMKFYAVLAGLQPTDPAAPAVEVVSKS
ncbi:MAG: hypothetical protein WAN23_00665 [Candidatus Acidiferrales bacterium]